eukprot:TRINITY_DN13875_c1_g1_i1.p1 TRINITY_DN13875_c1_g1~~TRINITY_DN13875_c1_g1_i1.p1  ORF type:complete len:102 (+),score=18.38 TRINITY_DN13875_c1_g1_i1:320-625(+)
MVLEIKAVTPKHLGVHSSSLRRICDVPPFRFENYEVNYTDCSLKKLRKQVFAGVQGERAEHYEELHIGKDEPWYVRNRQIKGGGGMSWYSILTWAGSMGDQ